MIESFFSAVVEVCTYVGAFVIFVSAVLGLGAVLAHFDLTPPVPPSTPRAVNAHRSCPRQSRPRVGSTEGRAHTRSIR